MANKDNYWAKANTNSHTESASQARTFSQGLRAHMQRVFNYMTLGLGITGVVAFITAQTPALMQLIYGTPLQWVVIFAPLAFILFGFRPAQIMNRSAGATATLFFIFAGVMGLSLSYIFLAYTGASITRVFLITSVMFLSTSLYGYTTKRDLTGLGSFLFMGVIGLLIAMVVNFFLASSAMDFMISVAGVGIFTGMTAFDVQQQKQLYRQSAGEEANHKLALIGAFSLYYNFILIMQFLLQLMGNRR
jgi:FtsH-binding integral membrane protein